MLFYGLFSTFSQAGGIFLTIQKSAQMVSMGYSGVARWEDPAALYLNPAAAAFKPGASFTTLNTTTFGMGELFVIPLLKAHSIPRRPNWNNSLASDSYNHYWEGGFSFDPNYPLIKRIAVRFSGTRFTIGRVMARTRDGKLIGIFTPYDRATSGSISLLLPYGIGLGYAYKDVYSFLCPSQVVKEVLGDSGRGHTRTGTHDFGILIDPGLGISLGAAIHNYSGTLRYSENGSSDPLPKYIRYGATFKLHELLEFLTKQKVSYIATFTYSQDEMRDLLGSKHEIWHGHGFELGFLGFLYLRRGYFKDLEGDRIGNTQGWGIRFGSIKFDVADDGDIYDFRQSHNWWVSLGLETPKKKGFLDYIIGEKNMGTIQALLFPGAGHIYLGNPRGIIYFVLTSSFYSLYKRKSSGIYLFLADSAYEFSLVDYILWGSKKWYPFSSIF